MISRSCTGYSGSHACTGISVGSTINATVSVGVLEAATDYKGQRSLPRDFSIELKQGSITNQRRSGRCWNPNRWNSIHGSRSPSVAADITGMERSRGWDCSHGFPVPLC